MSKGFFVLPPELRLEVYRHLFSISMADGKAGDVSGMLFSCRQTYNEMVSDCVPKVRVLLNSMNKWTAAHPEGKPLQVQLPNEYTFTNPPKSSMIAMPNASHWKTASLHLFRNSFRASVSHIEPVLALPWSKLTMRICFTITVPRNYRDQYFRMMYVVDRMWFTLLKSNRAPKDIQLVIGLELPHSCHEEEGDEAKELWEVVQAYLYLLRVHATIRQFKCLVQKKMVGGRDVWDVSFNI
jgi:hypothetical protein